MLRRLGILGIGMPLGAVFALFVAGPMMPTGMSLTDRLGSYRVQDRADVVQVIKVTTPATLRRIRKDLAKVHMIYLQRFDELLGAAKEEKEQERERGGAK